MTKYLNNITKQVLIIESDSNPESPRSWENMSIMDFYHGRYSLPSEGLELTSRVMDSYNSWQELCDDNYKNNKDIALIYPVHMMDHSGLSFSISEFGGDYGRFDSGQVGYIYVLKSVIRKDYGVKNITKKILERAKQHLLAELEIYNHYANGEVYGYSLYESSSAHDNGESSIDSVWGFYTHSEILAEVKFNDFKIID